MILQEMQTRSLNYEISVRGLFVALITEVMRLSTEQNDSASANRMVIAPALTYIDEFYIEQKTLSYRVQVLQRLMLPFRYVKPHHSTAR